MVEKNGADPAANAPERVGCRIGKYSGIIVRHSGAKEPPLAAASETLRDVWPTRP